MIEPNFDLFLWCIFVFYVFVGICNIFAGAMRTERSNKSGTGEVLIGLVMLLIVFLVCVF